MTTKIGFCRYCNNQRMVEVPDDATEELINQEATATCDCYRAKAEREKEYQKEACIANIDDMLGKKYPEIASLLKDSIDAIQASKIKKITVNTHFNQTIRLQKAKDGIKVELERKLKEESLARSIRNRKDGKREKSTSPASSTKRMGPAIYA